MDIFSRRLFPRLNGQQGRSLKTGTNAQLPLPVSNDLSVNAPFFPNTMLGQTLPISLLPISILLVPQTPGLRVLSSHSFSSVKILRAVMLLTLLPVPHQAILNHPRKLLSPRCSTPTQQIPVANSRHTTATASALTQANCDHLLACTSPSGACQCKSWLGLLTVYTYTPTNQQELTIRFSN